jgi:sugar diacid utilization regulator
MGWLKWFKRKDTFYSRMLKDAIKIEKKLAKAPHFKKDLTALRICIIILKRLADANYPTNHLQRAWNKHHAKWGPVRVHRDFDNNIFFKCANAKTCMEEATEKWEARAIRFRELEHYRRDYKLLWKLMEEHSARWGL